MPGSRTHTVVFCAALILGATPLSGLTQENLHRYTVTLDDELTTVSVNACLAGPPPVRLSAAVDSASDRLFNVRARAGETRRRLSAGSRGIRTRSLEPDECVEYQVDFSDVTGRTETRGLGRYGRDLLTPAGAWLWRPRSLDENQDIEVRFRLPDGISVSAPWEPADGSATYRVGRSPFSWPVRVAFGRFEITPVNVPGATLRLAVLDGSPEVNVRDMDVWLAEAAGAVTTLYGRFPLKSPQVLVVPAGKVGHPVPWGQVLRGGGAAALFVVDQFEPLSEYRADWTAAHELSHMLLPYVGRNDAWLSEGFASYYQNVVRARAGMISEQTAWQKLHDGYQRGVRGTKGHSLRSTSRNMRRHNSYMRVYWSGAAVALLADVRLRRVTDGRESLESALGKLSECCLPADRLWTAREVFDRLDALTGTSVFDALYREHAESRTFPDVSRAYELLGIDIVNGRVTFDRNPESRALRAAIMTNGVTKRTAGVSETADP